MEHFLRSPSRQPPYPNTYLLLSGGSGPRLSPSSSLRHPVSPLLVRRSTGIGASRPRLHDRLASAQPATVQPFHQAQEHPLPRVPGQQPEDQPSSAPHDLTRHLDHRRAERRELHPHHRASLGLMLGR